MSSLEFGAEPSELHLQKASFVKGEFVTGIVDGASKKAIFKYLKSIKQGKLADHIEVGIDRKQLSQYVNYLSESEYNQFLEDYVDLSYRLKDAGELIMQGNMGVSEFKDAFPTVFIKDDSISQENWKLMGSGMYYEYRDKVIAFQTKNIFHDIKRAGEVYTNTVMAVSPISVDENGAVTSITMQPSRATIAASMIVEAGSSMYDNYFDVSDYKMVPYAYYSNGGIVIQSAFIPITEVE